MYVQKSNVFPIEWQAGLTRLHMRWGCRIAGGRAVGVGAVRRIRLLPFARADALQREVSFTRGLGRLVESLPARELEDGRQGDANILSMAEGPKRSRRNRTDWKHLEDHAPKRNGEQ